ncbi:class F sortase [Arthrobacter agilis]|uniref:class F sortase n=1 Tax=Arthrobacter agilis TaxID=37921 RepID=UPI002364FF5A|nr:class F sortase [Arthrobacter agilis]WDF34164.1 class F sortase [Arthrobacter agilis]
MISRANGHRWGFTAPAVAALFLLAGCGSADAPSVAASASVTAAPSATAEGPTTAAPSATASPAPAGTPSSAPAAAPSPAASPQPDVLAASAPVTLVIPSVGVRSDLLSLGLRENQSLEVPPDGPGAPAGWYNQSPTPGDRGPAVLLGHVNATDGGKGVFADLRALAAGDRVDVLRADGSTATFEVQRGEQYQKDDFPTLTVYGNTPGSELRLITCDGYNPDTGEFDDNYVVYATLVL